MKSYYKFQRRICSEKEEDIPIVKNREREGTGIYEGLVEKRIYLTIKVTTDVTGVFCTEEGWEKEDGIRLLIFGQLDGQEQLSIATDIRFDK